MNLTAMINRVRYLINEPTAKRWTNANLVDHLNEAAQDVIDMLIDYDEDAAGASLVTAYLDTTVDVATTALPSDFGRLKRLEWLDGDTTLLYPAVLHQVAWQVEEAERPWPDYYYVSNTGTPAGYMFQGNNIRWVPIPDSTTTNAAKLYYIKALPKLSTGDPSFTGTGLDDLTSGTGSTYYTGNADATFTVVIDGVGSPNTFKWKKDSGAWTTGVAITGSVQTLSDGVTITFGATTGHTATDQWTIACTGTSIVPSRWHNLACLMAAASAMRVADQATGPIEEDIKRLLEQMPMIAINKQISQPRYGRDVWEDIY